MNYNVCCSLALLLLTVMTEMRFQGTKREKSFEHGLLLQTLPSIIILHPAPSMMEQQSGLSEVVHSMTGRRMVHCCGSVAIVRFSRLVSLSRLLMAFSVFSGVRKKYSLVRSFTAIPLAGNLYY